MQQILNFLIKYKVFLVFLLLLVAGLRFTFYAHTYQNTNFVNSTNFISANIYSIQSSVSEYFNLKSQNEVLHQENKLLRERLLNSKGLLPLDTIKPKTAQNLNLNDSLYTIIPAEVVSNNYNNPDNYLLLNKGTNDSIDNELAVFSSLGIIGITEYTSANFSRVISILNRNISINAKLKKSNHFGTLTWDAVSVEVAKLKDVPRSAPIAIGDTIITGGKSFIFPENFPIGTIQDFELIQGYFEIEVKLFNDMTNLGKVYILKRNNKTEAISTLNKDDNESE
ncbi:rod shape-determining protein MreC [Psychroflexus sp. ALD_RP9]|uniref:rod shape-determining protein MreC n=1 Tax=Psychroflexus sp. ALD_RP9 TaxID=2777186 RepID=UPI001A8C809F|nr:rod shape-determining protein MreC [Psychroflexus sp. ALD_RP9]QSS97771.1 rod shape-determining protein MreC [Psychroflexus sp. ALD_RP9]